MAFEIINYRSVCVVGYAGIFLTYWPQNDLASEKSYLLKMLPTG